MRIVAFHTHQVIIAVGVPGNILKAVALGFTQAAVDGMFQHHQVEVIFGPLQDLGGAVRAAVVDNHQAIFFIAQDFFDLDQ